MQIIFKKNLSPDNKCVKSFDSSTVTIDGYFLENTSITNPKIIVVADFAEISGYNYCDIATLNRKYFVVDMVSLDSERVEITLRCDVLSSFYDDILSARVLAIRSTKNINVFIPDNKLQTSTRGISQIKTFSGGEWLPRVLADTRGVVVSTFGGR